MTDFEKMEELRIKVKTVILQRNEEGYSIKEIFYIEPSEEAKKKGHTGFYLEQVKKNKDPRSIDLSDWSQKELTTKQVLGYYDEIMNGEFF